MSEEASWLHVALAAGFSSAGAWLFMHRWSRARHILDTPTSRVRSAAQGYVELCGVLEAPVDRAGLLGPLTNTPCLWWSYRIEEYRSSGKRSRWHLLESGSSTDWLRLVDGTGECLINPQGAEVVTSHRKVWTGSARHPLGHLRNEGWLGVLTGSGRYRYTEERLQVGDPLYAIGDFRSHGGGQDVASGAAVQGEVIRAWKQDFPALLARFDGDGNGTLDMAEWSEVQAAAMQEADARRRVAACAPLQHRLGKSAEGRPFVLSTRGQEELARRFYWQAVGSAVMCLAGALLAAVELRTLL